MVDRAHFDYVEWRSNNRTGHTSNTIANDQKRLSHQRYFLRCQIVCFLPAHPPATKCFHPATFRLVAGSFFPSFVGPEYAEVAVAGPSGDATVAVETLAMVESRWGRWSIEG